MHHLEVDFSWEPCSGCYNYGVNWILVSCKLWVLHFCSSKAMQGISSLVSSWSSLAPAYPGSLYRCTFYHICEQSMHYFWLQMFCLDVNNHGPRVPEKKASLAVMWNHQLRRMSLANTRPPLLDWDDGEMGTAQNAVKWLALFIQQVEASQTYVHVMSLECSISLCSCVSKTYCYGTSDHNCRVLWCAYMRVCVVHEQYKKLHLPLDSI